jgi:hypothetical protein
MADAAYSLWPLLILNTLLFAAFGLSFFPDHVRRAAYVYERRADRRTQIRQADWPPIGQIPVAHNDIRAQDHPASRHSADE